MINTGLYLHIPFCYKKCKYCNFYSINFNRDTVDFYIKEMCNEIKKIADLYRNDIKIDTIYFGGGTPSLLSGEQFATIMECITKNLSIDKDVEITVEANPSSIKNIAEYKKVGANRISVGLQSTNDLILKKIGRLHNAKDGLSALEFAKKIYDNVSCDIILGCDSAQNPIQEINEIKDYANHISAYLLTVEESTPIYNEILSKNVSIATEDEMIIQYETFVNVAKEEGFFQYETSNFSKEGKNSKHNSKYWDLSPYIGIGAGAYSFFDGRRYYNTKSVTEYINGAHFGNKREIVEREKSIIEDEFEFIMLSLRTVKGVDLKTFEKKFHKNFVETYKNQLNNAKEYLSISDNNVKILPQYFILQNAIERLILL